MAGNTLDQSVNAAHQFLRNNLVPKLFSNTLESIRSYRPARTPNILIDVSKETDPLNNAPLIGLLGAIIGTDERQKLAQKITDKVKDKTGAAIKEESANGEFLINVALRGATSITYTHINSNVYSQMKENLQSPEGTKKIHQGITDSLITQLPADIPASKKKELSAFIKRHSDVHIHTNSDKTNGNSMTITFQLHRKELLNPKILRELNRLAF